MSFDFEYNRYLDVFNGYLNETLNKIKNSAPQILIEAMNYAVSDGGKRVRPVLCLATAEMLGLNCESVKEYALAIEFIHSYSLVHDDLPAMDNDDFRRGKLSTHKKFGEAFGILAGDALLNFAFEICLSRKNVTEKDVEAMRLIAEYAGFSGMIGGQVLDLQNEGKSSVGEIELYDIYLNKTAKLIMAPVLVSATVAGSKYYEKLKDFAYNLGVTFQITDDILDEVGSIDSIGKTPHKDKAVDKLTAIKILGLDGAKDRATEHYLNCKRILSEFENSKFLSDFTDAMYFRKK